MRAACSCGFVNEHDVCVGAEAVLGAAEATHADDGDAGEQLLPRCRLSFGGFGAFRCRLEFTQGNLQRRTDRALIDGGKTGAGVLNVDDAQRPAHGRTQGFSAAQVAHGAHRLGGVRVACQQGGNLGGERFLPQRFEVGDLVQPGDGGRGILEQIGHGARAGE